MKIETTDKNVWFEVLKDVDCFIVDMCIFGDVENPKTKEINEKVTRKRTWHGNLESVFSWILNRAVLNKVNDSDVHDMLKIIEDVKNEIISKIPQGVEKKTRKKRENKVK